MKKNIFSAVYIAVMLLCLSTVLFGCTEPENIGTQQSENADVDVSVADFEMMHSVSADVNVTVLDDETQEIDSTDVDMMVADDIKQNQPVVTAQVSLPPRYYTTQQDREKFCGMDLRIFVDSKTEKFVECVLQVTYDPAVLECADAVCPWTELAKLIREITILEPGKILIKVFAFASNYTDEICFHVLSNEEINLDISLVSYTDESGVRENAQLVVDMPVKVPVVKDLTNN